MSAMSRTGVFEQFVAAINGHDIDDLTSLMTQDHLFVDSMGNRIQGAESMQAGWRGYFVMCPDYWIQIRTVLSERDTVLATGEAGALSMVSLGECPQRGRLSFATGSCRSGESLQIISRSMKSWRDVDNSRDAVADDLLV
jgi:hypothetical protein